MIHINVNIMFFLQCCAFSNIVFQWHFNSMKGCKALKFMQFHFFLCPCGILHSTKLGTIWDFEYYMHKDEN